MKIKNIELILENCDSFKLEPKHFKGLILNNITDKLYVNCYQYTDGEINRFKDCKHFSIELNESSFELESDMVNEKLIKRLLTPDIVYVELIYDDDSKENIYVPFEGEYNNKLQTTKFINNKIIIEISYE
jgi:hypothetical protein